MQTGASRDRSVGVVVCEPADPAPTQLYADSARCLPPINIALLTGGQDPHYTVGLGTALMGQNVLLDVIGGDEIDLPAFKGNPRASFHNLHGTQRHANPAKKIIRILAFYARLFRFTLTAKPKVFHILWNNKLQILDRTAIMLFYKLGGKKVVFTAHNINAGKRDRSDSWLNRITLRCQYALSDHIFVHTTKMKDELVGVFDVRAQKVTVIPYGINNAVPFTELNCEVARQQFGLQNHERVLLCFGAIKQYKGLEYLVAAFQQIAERGDYRLIIAGERKKGHEEYWRSIQQAIDSHPSRDKIMQKIQFIPDAETEAYFKAADVAVLPYTDIFQSGILFVAFNYGLPVIATDVGSFSHDIVEDKTGLVCRPCDSDDLAKTIEKYFESDLYRELAQRRPEIRDFTIAGHSWETVAGMTRDVYTKMLKRAS
jgi:D-inositol-3-phosphate glycosyltransferase